MKHGLVYVLLTLSAFFWGATFNFAKYSVHYLSPPSTAAIRFTIAAGLMILVLGFQGRSSWAILRRNWRPILAMAAFGVVGFNTFFFLSMRFTSPTNGSLIQATNPLVTALIAGLFYQEPISRGHKIGTTISFLGVATLLLAGTGHRLTAPNIGDVFMIVACTCFAFYAIFGRRYLKGSTPTVTTGLTTIIGALPLWLVALAVVPRPTPSLLARVPAVVYLAILFMGVLGSVVAYIFWNYGISQIGVADTAVFFHLVPVFTVLVSFVLGQSVTLVQILAGIVVMGGVAISSGTVRTLRAAASRHREVVAVEPPVAPMETVS